MAKLKNYSFNMRDTNGAVFQGGGVMASDDQLAMIEVATAIRSIVAGSPQPILDHLVSITRPDGALLGAPATVAEFLKR